MFCAPLRRPRGQNLRVGQGRSRPRPHREWWSAACRPRTGPARGGDTTQAGVGAITERKMPRSSIRCRLARAPRSCARRGAVTVSDEHPQNRRILVITDNEMSANLVGDAFETNAYDVLATSDMNEAARFSTTHHPGCILLMLSSLTLTCDAARQLRPHTATRIIAFSTMPVTAAERNTALQGGCDDYRDAFLRIDNRG